MPWAGFVKPINFMDNLGRRGRDVITGFQGTITSKHLYLTGCAQYGITPDVSDSNSHGETQFFDEVRVEVSGEKVSLVQVINIE
jgi:hypothetical protein